MQPRIAHASGLPPTSAEIVVGRLLKGAKGPLPDFLARLVISLHALARETKPTPAQWCDARYRDVAAQGADGIGADISTTI